jgi:hypothetical protein
VSLMLVSRRRVAVLTTSAMTLTRFQLTHTQNRFFQSPSLFIYLLHPTLGHELIYKQEMEIDVQDGP